MSTCRNIRFIASAGTGKTHQVVALYQSLLFGRPYPADDSALPGVKAGTIFDGHTRLPPERILMLTFTKNAAAEMRSRVTEAIEQELATGNPETEAFCWSLMRQLSSATISTIHSFAQQILASNTLFLGLSPALTILEETEAEDLRKDVIESTLKAALTGTDAGYTDDLECLCDGRGVQGIEEGITRMLRLGAAWGLNLEKAEPAALVATPQAPKPAALQKLLKPLAQAAEARTGKTLKAMATELSATLRRLGAEPTAAAMVKAATDLRALTTSSWGTDEGVKELRKEVQGKLDALIAYPDRVHATRLLISFLTLAGDCARHIQARKRAQGVLDFDDLLFKARDLIEARPGCVPALDVIIVDEAQDNSRLQNDLIRLVQSVSGASMVLCGDTKQTIYGWRGADAEGLTRFSETMQLDAVPLRTSYRSQKGILDWVNDIFAGVILGVDRYGEHETLAPCPGAMKLEGPSVELLLPEWEWGPNPNDPITTGKKQEQKPRLTLTPREVRTLAAGAPADTALQSAADQTEQALALEARAVARRIRLLTMPGTGAQWHPAQVWDSSKSGWVKAPAHPYRFRDILILLRASSRQELYEQALQEEGIPFTTDGKGRGFFSRQETLDVSNLLSWLAFPHDRLALLGLLRSPFVALSDNAVAAMGSTLMDLKSEISDPVDRATLGRAEPILARLRTLAGRISAVELVREAVRLTGYDAILAGTFHGVQRLANLQKLLSWIQTRERDETLNLQETARRLADEIALGREAPDAAVLDPDDDSVRINTVHAAKGLSSPVVILPDLRRSPQTDRDWMLVTRNENGEAAGVAGKIKVYADDDAGEIESELYEEARERNKDSRDHESRRLFYVACTRARDLLVLSGENPGNGSKDAWRSWINQHLLQCDFNASLIRLRPYGEVERAWRKIAATPPDRDIPTPAHFLAASRGHQAIAGRERYRFPVTALLQACSASPQPALRLSLASVSVTSAGQEDHEIPEPVLDRSQRGTLAHRILETLDYASGLALGTQIDQSPDWGDASAAEQKLIRPQIESAALTLSRLLAGVAPHNLIRELPFAARFNHDGAELIVDGKVDLLFLKDGIWHIVDYKFSDHDAETLKAHYALQLAVYREALSTATGSPPLRCPRFAGAGTKAAAFKLILLGITGKGQCREIDMSDAVPADLAPILIAAARTLHA
jgi:ATP-dependent exoDNAse (exonuclease V) beta subunit